ncbi:hypothetical protein XENOCAPTIV_010655 [Xenoophorus captivus]|uniref:Uncharacterized protein n=1 Tax=Xenoophorus captivus TaxID=1517983 RepID=A0ABV0RLX0_9TELE
MPRLCKAEIKANGGYCDRSKFVTKFCHKIFLLCSRWRTHAFSLPPSCLLLHLLLSVFFSEPHFTYLPNLQIMDLVSWSLNATDKIFSTGRQGKGEPSCPAGTFFSGYTMDSWQQWKIVCWTTVEDAKDVYIFGFLITGFLLFGVGGYLTYRVSSKTWAAVQSIPKLPAMLDGICRAINAQTELLRELSRKLDTVFEQNCSLEAAFGLRGKRI